jgi:AmmeMemoRadiSam system protein A
VEKKLTAENKKLLLKIARDAIVSSINNDSFPLTEPTSPQLHEKRGCFACIKIDGKLRGCIGNFISDKPLYRLVREMAVSAATQDPRFYPMKKEDIAHFNLEISVLTPLRKITSIEEIEVGVHGLYIEKNYSRGVLLPQVAIEYGWDRDTFLSQTSMKAGMKADDWKEGADIYVFSADVFTEK